MTQAVAPNTQYGGYFLEQFQSQFQTKRSDGGLICVFTMVRKPICNSQIEYVVDKKRTHTVANLGASIRFTIR